MQSKCLLLALSAWAFCALIPIAPAQTAAPQTATKAAITFANAGSLTLHSTQTGFPMIGLNANEAVTIELQFPQTIAGTLIAIQPLDGGSVTGQNTLIAVDGKTSFQFRAASQPGLYRVLFNANGKPSLFRFWVADPNNPAANPPTLRP
jgi:hypothetical protein